MRLETHRSTDRRLGIDGLRAVAFFAVLFLHAHVPGCQLGFLGVDVFFVISGFVITRMLTNEVDRFGNIDFRRFFMRRAFRLLPMVFVVSVFAISWSAIDNSHNFASSFTGNVRGFVSSVFVVNNFVVDHNNHSSGALAGNWSLSIEEQFYLVWPFLVPPLFFGSISTRTRKVLLLALTVTAMMHSAQVLESNPYVKAWFRTDVHIAGLLTGCCLAYWRRERSIPAVPAALPVLAFVALIATHAQPAVTVPAAFVVSAFLVTSADARPGLLGNPIIVGIGRRTYGLYLWSTMLLLCLHTYDLPGPVFTFGGIALCFAFNEVSYRLIERPCHTYARDRFRRRGPDCRPESAIAA